MNDRAVCCEVTAGITLTFKDIENFKNVLPHEEFSTRQVYLKSYLVWERGAKCIERQFFAPLTFQVEEVSDPAKATMQIASHGAFVHGAVRKSVGYTGALTQESSNLAFVLLAAILGQKAARDRTRWATR